MAFDAAMLEVAEHVAEPDALVDSVPTVEPSVADSDASVAVLTSPDHSSAPIVFIDRGVADIAALISGIDPSAEIVLLDADRSGLTQIAEYLDGRSNVAQIHIISHGAAGRLYLGGEVVTADTLSAHAADIAAIGRSLSESGDILIYGCDVAAGPDGQAFVDRFAALTEADLAASEDLTGSAAHGGDWDLEYQAGTINVQAFAAVNWEQLLNPIAITNVDGTTVTATTLANNIAGAGVTVVAATFSGDNTQAGLFTGATGYPAEWLAYDTGVVFTSGRTSDIAQANAADNTTFNSPSTGTDAEFTSLGGTTSFDSSFVSIDFIPNSSRITLQFTFGSEEYNEYVYAQFNDALGVWVNGSHVSLTPSGTPIAINTVNQAGTFTPTAGTPDQNRDPNPGNGTFDSSNPSLFINNPVNGSAFNVVFDGFTVTMTLVADVNVGVTNSIRIGVADIGDASLDSYLFVRENSLQAETIANTDFAGTAPGTAVTINALANDTDTQNDPLTITHVADKAITAGGPAITLGSGATVQLTAGGQLLYTPPATIPAGGETFTYTISDGTGSTAVGFVHVDIANNTAPVVDLNGGTAGTGFAATYTEGAAAVAVVGATAVVTDTTDISFASISVSLGGFLSSGREILNIGGSDFTFGIAQTTNVLIGTTNFVVTYDGAAAVSVINAAPGSEISDAAVEDFMRSFTYRHTGDEIITGSRTLGFVVNDGQLNSAVATSTIAVNAVNDAPVNSLPASFSFSSPNRIIGLSISDPDRAAGDVNVTTTLAVSAGTLTAVSGGGVTVTGSGSGSIVLTGTITAINTFLVSNAPTFTWGSTGAVTLTVTTNDGGNIGGGGALTDVDNVVFTVVAASAPIVDLNSGPTTNVGSANTTSGLISAANGGFGTTAQATPPSPWVEGTTNAAGAVVLNGTDGRWLWTTNPGANATLSYGVTAIGPTTTTTTTANTVSVATTTDAITAITFGLAWQNFDITTPTTDNQLVVSYNGVTYATFETFETGTQNQAGLTGTWTYQNGATGPATTNSVANATTGALSSITINLAGATGGPITSSGTLRFLYRNGSTGAGTDYIAIDNVGVTSTRTTVTTTTTADTANNNWTATYTENGAAVSIADTDSSIFDSSDTAIESATITLTTPQTGDRLLVDGSAAASGTLASGISWTRTNSLVTFTGSFSRAQYADAIELVTFENTADNPNTTNRTITVVVNDGVSNSNTATTTITVVAVNDTPVNTVSAAQSVNDGSVLTFSSANGNLVSIADVDAGAATVRVTLAVANGTLTLSGVTGLTFTAGDGTADATMTFSGTVAAINTALAGLQYTPAADTSLTDTLTITTNDLGNTGNDPGLTGTATSEQDVDTVAISINRRPTINLDPNNSGGGANDRGWSVTYTENSAAVLVADIDADVSDIAQNDLLSLGIVIAGRADGASEIVRIGGTDFPTNANAGPTTVTVGATTFTVAFNTATGTFAITRSGGGVMPQADLDTLVRGVSYRNSSEAPTAGNRTLTFTLSDGVLTSLAAVSTIAVSPVNDAPTNTVPGAQATTEDTARVFSAANSNLITVADVDTGTLTVTVAVTNGTFSLSGIAGLTFTTGDGTADATMTFSGTAAAINTALAGASYIPTADYNGSAQLTLTTNDGVAPPVVNTVALTVSADADIAGDSYTFNEDSTAQTLAVLDQRHLRERRPHHHRRQRNRHHRRWTGRRRHRRIRHSQRQRPADLHADAEL